MPVDWLFRVQVRAGRVPLWPRSVDSAVCSLHGMRQHSKWIASTVSGSCPHPSEATRELRAATGAVRRPHPPGLRGEVALTGPLGQDTRGRRDPVPEFSGFWGEALCDVGTGVSWQAGSMPVTPWSGGIAWKLTEACFRPTGSAVLGRPLSVSQRSALGPQTGPPGPVSPW